MVDFGKIKSGQTPLQLKNDKVKAKSASLFSRLSSKTTREAASKKNPNATAARIVANRKQGAVDLFRQHLTHKFNISSAELRKFIPEDKGSITGAEVKEKIAEIRKKYGERPPMAAGEIEVTGEPERPAEPIEANPFEDSDVPPESALRARAPTIGAANPADPSKVPPIKDVKYILASIITEHVKPMKERPSFVEVAYGGVTFKVALDWLSETCSVAIPSDLTTRLVDDIALPEGEAKWSVDALRKAIIGKIPEIRAPVTPAENPFDTTEAPPPSNKSRRNATAQRSEAARKFKAPEKPERATNKEGHWVDRRHVAYLSHRLIKERLYDTYHREKPEMVPVTFDGQTYNLVLHWRNKEVEIENSTFLTEVISRAPLGPSPDAYDGTWTEKSIQKATKKLIDSAIFGKSRSREPTIENKKNIVKSYLHMRIQEYLATLARTPLQLHIAIETNPPLRVMLPLEQSYYSLDAAEIDQLCGDIADRAMVDGSDPHWAASMAETLDAMEDVIDVR